MTLTKQSIIWVIVIVLGGGILGLLTGQGFWGEKAPQEQVISGDTISPPQSAQCRPDCSSCHDM